MQRPTIDIKLKRRDKWTALLTPKPFEIGQYLAQPNGSYCRIIAIHERHVEVMIPGGVETERRMTYLRQDIKDGYTRQLNATEFKLYRMLYE